MRNVYVGWGRGVACRWILIALTGALLGPAAAAQRPPARRRPTTQTPTTAAKPAYKGVFEPVNYNQDLKLTDVYFASAEEGWVSGDHGTILHTSDGGKTWQAQLGGDPQSQERPIDHLRFEDARHGWALQPAGGGVKLLRTTDGENWEQAGTPPLQFGLIEYQFVSPSVGLLLDANANGSRIYRTTDGGRTWKETFPPDACRFNAEVQGLPHQVGCALITLAVASPTEAYAVGFVWADLPDVFVEAKTQDGGVTWGLAVMHGPSNVFDYYGRQWQRLFFSDPQNGLLATASERLYATSDGGTSWHGVAGAAGPQIRFADPEVGWAFGDLGNRPDYVLRYTTDGGKRWSSRSLHFPAGVFAFALPQRNAGYVVGDHGMVYRYRIVPAEYKVANMVEAPVMPGYDSPLNGEVATLKSDFNDLATQMQNSLGISSPPAAAGTTSQGSSGGFQQSAPPSSQQDTSQGGFQQSAAPTPDANQGAFQQSAPMPGTAGQAGGFQQSTGAAGGGVVASCCGPAFQKLQMAANSFATDLPRFSGKFRNLNLITAGLQFVNDLLQRTNALKMAIANLQGARDKQSASVALANLSAQVNGIPNNVNGGFVQDTSGAFPQPAQAPMSFSPAGQPANPKQPAAAPSSTQPASPAQTAKPDETKKQDSTTAEIKNKLKKKFGIKFP